jgi:hypothetical protein
VGIALIPPTGLYLLIFQLLPIVIKWVQGAVSRSRLTVVLTILYIVMTVTS